jgi:hypothetical protein
MISKYDLALLETRMGSQVERGIAAYLDGVSQGCAPR